MPLPVFEKQDDVPEAFRGEYEEREGKWHPKVPDVTKLNSALAAEREKREEEEKARKKVERELADLKRKESAKESGVTEDQLKKLQEEDEKKRKPIEEELEKTKAELRRIKHTDKVRALALSLGVMQDRIDDAMEVLGNKRTKLTDDGDSIVVLDKEGKPTGEKIEDFLKTTFKKEKPWFYAGPGASGSGAEGSSATGGADAGAYDPVKAGKDAAAAQKKGRDNSLAFQ